MGFRFRKSVRLFPGVGLNFSKSGVSTSIGGRGATVNIGKRGVRGTVSLPGTGLSCSDMLVKRSKTSTDDGSDVAYSSAGKRILIFLAIGAGVLLLLAFLGSRSNAPETTIATVGQSTEPAAMTEATSSGSSTTMAKVNCRSEPSKRSQIVASIEAETTVSVLATGRGWSKIVSGGSDCWVSSDYLG